MLKGTFESYRGSVVALICLCLSVILAPTVMAQGNAGRILGTVTDQTGGAIAGSTVTVTNVGTNITRTLKTDDAGEYTAPNLIPGMYMVSAESNGFKKVERQNIVLEIGQDLRVDLQLQPGEVTQTVTVTESVPLVETTNAEMGGTLQSQIIESLPINGRNFAKMLSLRPGVTIYPGNPSYSQSTNGLRAHDNTYLIDGVNSSDPWMAQPIVTANMSAGDAGTLISIDAIDEFKTEENPRAEYGWKPGAVVNVGVKSGTNSYHGSAYAYGRDGAWDARNFFNATTTPVSVEQYGATFGGPIKKDKVFYFVNFEEQRYEVGGASVFSTPITAVGVSDSSVALVGPKDTVLSASNLLGACQQALDIGAPGSGTPGALTALSAQMAGIQVGAAAAGHPNGTCAPAPNYPGLFPANGGTAGVGSAAFIQGTSLINQNKIDTGLGKVDWHVNDKHALNFMYFISPGDGIFNDSPSEVNPIWELNQYARSQVFATNWVYTPSSAWVNEARVGYSHYYQTYLSADNNDNPANYAFNGSTYHFYTGQTNPAYFGLPALGISTFTGAIGAGFPKQVGPDGILQILDHVSYLRGKHAFKFGVEILDDNSTSNVTSNAKGPITFESLPAFFAGAPNLTGSTNDAATLLVGNFSRHFTFQGYGLFLQDDYRITPRLTLNLGLRYELDTVPKERDNLQGNFNPNTLSGLAQPGINETSPYNGDHNNFAPRIGIAWDIFGNGKTVVRAGGGIFYEQLSLDVLVGIGNTFGLRVAPTGVALYSGCAGGVGSANKSCQTPSPGTISALNVSYTNTPVTNNFSPGDIPFQWANNSPANPIFSFAPACGDGTGSLSTGFTPQPCNVMWVNPQLRTPYVTTYNLDIQRSITNTVSIEVGYVGNHATKLIGVVDNNQPVAVTANVAGVGVTTFGPGYTAAGLAKCAATPTKTNCAPSTALEQAGRPFNAKFPYFKYVDQYGNFDTSNYNGLQAVLTARNYHGMTATVGYTYSRALGEAGDQASIDGLFLPVNSYASIKQLYGPISFDMTHRLTISESYNLPGRDGFGQMLKGWSIDSTTAIQTGTPWGIQDSTTDFAGTGEQAQSGAASAEGSQWDFLNAQGGPGNHNDFQPVHDFLSVVPGAGATPNPGIPYFKGTNNSTCLALAQKGGPLQVASLTNLGCYALGNSYLLPPPYGGYGTMSRNPWRDAGYKSTDLSIVKQFKFTERLSAQFRGEFFNVFNHTNFANPYGRTSGLGATQNPSRPGAPGLGFVTFTPDTAASNPVLGAGGSRDIQLGMKLTF